MEKAGLIVSGFALSSGVGATILLASNLILWAIITAWVGSLLAFTGFALIILALAAKQRESAEPDETEPAEQSPPA